MQQPDSQMVLVSCDHTHGREQPGPSENQALISCHATVQIHLQLLHSLRLQRCWFIYRAVFFFLSQFLTLRILVILSANMIKKILSSQSYYHTLKHSAILSQGKFFLSTSVKLFCLLQSRTLWCSIRFCDKVHKPYTVLLQTKTMPSPSPPPPRPMKVTRFSVLFDYVNFTLLSSLLSIILFLQVFELYKVSELIELSMCEISLQCFPSWVKPKQQLLSYCSPTGLVHANPAHISHCIEDDDWH